MLVGGVESMRNQKGKANNNYRHGQTIGGVQSKEYLRKAKARYRIRHREKHLAHKAIQAAVARGKIVRGNCEICGSKNAHAHHDDYSNQFDVRWLCRQHHQDEHK